MTNHQSAVKEKFNVSYEIGYAIGIKKRVLLIRNSTITSDDNVVLKVGIFDTLGHERYSNSEELSQITTVLGKILL